MSDTILLEGAVDRSPFRQFDLWYRFALEQKFPEPTACTLATSTRDGLPSARVVLLKSYDERGFVFFTNFESQKGRELSSNPRACIVFHWPVLARQIRVNGVVQRTSDEESDAYFATRPRISQVGAWASAQSRVASSRETLETQVAEVEARYAGASIPRPPHWGGFRLEPTSLEFWQGREGRLHDRLRYTRRADDQWRLERLFP